MSLSKKPLCRIRVFSVDKSQKTFWSSTVYENEVKNYGEVINKIKGVLK